MVSGGILAVVQLDRVDALWTTSYGIVLSCKLAAVTALLALAAVNRYVFTPRYQRGDATVAGSLRRTMTAEFCIVAVILALVALWRFTPPPRALAASEPVEVHLHGARAMAQVSLMPVRARDPRVNIEVLDGEFNALTVKEVTVTLANPAAGIEPVRRAAHAFQRRALARRGTEDSRRRAMDRARRSADRRLREDRAGGSGRLCRGCR